MEKVELLRKLIKLNVPPRYYSIGEEIKDYAHNIEKLYNGTYAVYYLERGEKSGLKIFNTEEEALSKLIERLEEDIKDGLDIST